MSAKKSKEKIYFTLKWTQKRQIHVTKKLLGGLGLSLLGLFLVLSIGIGSGSFRFAYGFVRCGALPVETSQFLTKTVTMPGENGYGPSPFSTFNHCTREDAQADGFGPFVVSEEQKQQDIAAGLAREEAKRFSPEKVSYAVYTPQLEGYEVSDIYLSQIQSNLHTFMRIKKNGTVVGSIRELTVDDSYNICDPSDNPKESYCDVIGKDSAGHDIKRSFYYSRNGWDSRYVGINIDGTGIILTSDDDAEAVRILGSLRKYTGE